MGRRPLIDLFPPLEPPVEPPPQPAPPVLAPPPARMLPQPQPAAIAATSESFYGLIEEPFSLTTDPRFFYHSTAHDRVAQMLLGAIGRREGLVIVTGEAGLGKTILCRAVIDQLDRRTLTSLVAAPSISTEEFLKTVLADFGVISRDDLARGVLGAASRADLAATLQEFLVSLAGLQAFAVVILDDAHDLPPALLEEVRALVEGLGDEPLLQIVLVGEPALETTLGKTALRQWNARITTRARLKPIADDEIGFYIAHRLAVSGNRPRVEFDREAAARVYELTGGVPRDINVLCARALGAGFQISASLLDAPIVNAAADELGLTAPPSHAAWREKAAILLVFLLLAAVGAAAAAFVFRSDLSALVSQWRNPPASRVVPQTPPSPPR